jgi:hypothetical protein
VHSIRIATATGGASWSRASTTSAAPLVFGLFVGSTIIVAIGPVDFVPVFHDGSNWRGFNPSRCEFDLLFYNSQSQANWSRKNGQALPAVRGEISNTEI